MQKVSRHPPSLSAQTRAEMDALARWFDARVTSEADRARKRPRPNEEHRGRKSRLEAAPQ
jgi:hypothetical protein